MDEPTRVIKGEIWTLFGDKALAFAAWLTNTTNPNSVAVKVIFNSVETINLESVLFNQVLQMLLDESIITSVQTDAAAARIAELHALPSFGD